MGGRVEVAVVEGAPGFAMREELTGRLGPATAPTHRLDVTLRLEQTGVALTEQDVTTRYNVTGTADYALVPLAGGPPVGERHGAGDHRLQRARVGRPPRPSPASRRSATPSGGWRSSSPTGSCSGWRSSAGDWM